MLSAPELLTEAHGINKSLKRRRAQHHGSFRERPLLPDDPRVGLLRSDKQARTANRPLGIESIDARAGTTESVRIGKA